MLEKLSHHGYPKVNTRLEHNPSHIPSVQGHSTANKPKRSRLSRTLKTIALASFTFSCVVLVGWVAGQKTVLQDKAVQAEEQLQTAPVEGLVTAIQAIGQNRQRLPWEILPEVESSLLSAVQSARERQRFEQPGKVYAATFTPDAQRIAAAGEEGNIHLWDLQDTQTQILQGNRWAIGSIHFSPDGSAVFANPATTDGAVQLWNLQDEPRYQSPGSQGQLISAAFSSDGQMVISGGASGRVQLWNPAGEWIANLYPRQRGSIGAVAFEGGSIVSGGEDGNITLWDTKGNLQGRLWAGARVTSLNLSQGGQRIISQDLNRQQAFIWDAQASQWNQFLLGETTEVRAATLNPDNTIVARGNHDGSVQLLPLDAQNQKFPTRSLLGHQGMVNAIAFRQDGKTVLTGGEDGTVRLWDVWDGTLLTKYHLQQWNQDSTGTAALSANGNYLVVSGEQGEASLRDIEQNTLALFSDDLKQNISQLFFISNNQVATVQTENENRKTITVWNADESQIKRFSIDLGEPIRTIAMSQDGQRVISLSHTNHIQLWDINGNPLSQPIAAHSSTQFLQFSPNGQQMISGGSGADGQTCLWQIQRNTLRQTSCHALASQVAAFNPDGKTVAIGSDNGKLYQWNLRNRQLMLTSQSHAAPITAIAFNADGTRMVSGSADGILRLADAQGKPIGQSFVGHQAAIRSLAFRQNDQSVVSLGQDGEVRVWQAGWQGWLETACNRLQYHPILRSPTTPETRSAQATCQRYAWSSGSTTTKPTSGEIGAIANASETPAPQANPTEAIAEATRLVVKLGERKVYVYQGETVQASYPLAIGKAGWETPTGTFRVYEMLQDPAWTHPITRERMNSGAENPLGTRWIGFWSDQYNKIGFHGTPDRNSVGQAISHGCLRMYDEDARALYEQIKLGTVVVVEQ
jgi:WD40 repeat protein